MNYLATMLAARRSASYVNGFELPPYNVHMARASVRVALRQAWLDFTTTTRNGINNRTQRKHRRTA